MSARFDIHQHFGKLIGVPGSAGRTTTPQEDRDVRVAFLEQFGIGQCALMPGHSYAAPNGLADVRAINDGLHAYGALAPDRFVAVFGTLDPRHGMANVAEVERLAGLGFRGLSWRDDDDESNLDRMDTAAADLGYANVGFRVVRELGGKPAQ